MVEASGLADFYRAEREGTERLENLGELVNAAEAFVTQEGFGKDAVALPVDEQAPVAQSVGTPSADAQLADPQLLFFVTIGVLWGSIAGALPGRQLRSLMEECRKLNLPLRMIPAMERMSPSMSELSKENSASPPPRRWRCEK